MSVFLLYVAVFAGAMLTIFSPCILPVLPFVLGRAGSPFRSETVPLLAGLIGAFVVVARGGSGGAGWVAAAADTGRIVALTVLAVAGAALLSPHLASRVTRPFVEIGGRLMGGSWQGDAGAIKKQRASSRSAAPVRAFVLGLATGMVWAPCAGPILGLVAAGAATGASPALAATLFAAFGAGAAVALAVGVFSSGRVLHLLRRVVASEADLWLRRGLGAAAVATAVLIATGRDGSVFASGGIAHTAAAHDAGIATLRPHTEVPSPAHSLSPPPAPGPTPTPGA